MKAAAFDYHKARSIDEAIGLMQAHGDEARLLAGGQTLLATLNMRLSEPAILIDINHVRELKGIERRGDVLRIGALVRHSEIESSELVARHAPLLRMAVPHIAHRAIRNLGTWGGSLAYADPAAEWPACACALDGVMVVRGPGGERRIAARDFFLDIYSTALQEAEMLIACEIPVRQPDQVFGFQELARRHGDYAIAGLAAAARRSDEKLIAPSFVFFAVGNTPVRAVRTAAVVDGQALTPVLLKRAQDALGAELSPMADLTHSEATKRHLCGVLLERVIRAMAA